MEAEMEMQAIKEHPMSELICNNRFGVLRVLNFDDKKEPHISLSYLLLKGHSKVIATILEEFVGADMIGEWAVYFRDRSQTIRLIDERIKAVKAFDSGEISHACSIIEANWPDFIANTIKFRRILYIQEIIELIRVNKLADAQQFLKMRGRELVDESDRFRPVHNLINGILAGNSEARDHELLHLAVRRNNAHRLNFILFRETERMGFEEFNHRPQPRYEHTDEELNYISEFCTKVDLPNLPLC